MPRPQFTLRSLLVAMLVVAAFFGGMAVQKRLDRPLERHTRGLHLWRSTSWVETMVLRDGTEWHRSWLTHDDSDEDQQ